MTDAECIAAWSNEIEANEARRGREFSHHAHGLHEQRMGLIDEENDMLRRWIAEAEADPVGWEQRAEAQRAESAATWNDWPVAL